MKIMLQSILLMDTNKMPSETFSSGNIKIKCLISLYGEGVHFGLGKRRRGEKMKAFIG